MQPNKRKELTRARVLFYVTTFVALVIVALIFAGCSKDTNRNESGARQLASPTATPTPVPAPTPNIMLPGDTIIVIKDGSVKILVNKPVCPDENDPSRPNDKKFKCENVELESVKLENDLGIIATPAITPASKITVDGGGGGKEIKIEGKPNANPKNVSIQFPKDPYPSCDLDGEYLGINHVGTVKIDSFTKTCTPSEHCKLTVKIK